MFAWPWLLVPALLQSLLMGIDELLHRRRGLGIWERWGHPLDSLFFSIPLGITLVWPWSSGAAREVYAGFSVASCLLVTKDEAVHARECGVFEHRLHALLFMGHPVILLATAALWSRGEAFAFRVAHFGATLAFATYQLIYWNGMAFRWKR